MSVGQVNKCFFEVAFTGTAGKVRRGHRLNCSENLIQDFRNHLRTRDVRVVIGVTDGHRGIQRGGDRCC